MEFDSLNKIRKAKGFKIKVYTNASKYRVRVNTSNVINDNYYGINLSTQGEVKEISVLFSELTQENWGENTKPVPFVKSLIGELSFQTKECPLEKVEFVVSDIQIIP